MEGDPLIFCLKLDEVEIIHGHKLEQVSITLMNHALNPTIKPGSKIMELAYFPNTLWYHPQLSLLCRNHNPWETTTTFPKHLWTQRVSLFCECWRHLKRNEQARELASTIADASACYPYWVSSTGEKSVRIWARNYLWYPYPAEPT